MLGYEAAIEASTHARPRKHGAASATELAVEDDRVDRADGVIRDEIDKRRVRSIFFGKVRTYGSIPFVHDDLDYL